MTHKTISDLANSDAVLRKQRFAQRLTIAGGRPAHVGDLISRAEMGRRIAMTVQAKFHRERLGAIG